VIEALSAVFPQQYDSASYSGACASETCSILHINSSETSLGRSRISRIMGSRLALSGSHRKSTMVAQAWQDRSLAIGSVLRCMPGPYFLLWVGLNLSRREGYRAACRQYDHVYSNKY
jgi:hypothetical protein